jgi:hypothetical protein
VTKSTFAPLVAALAAPADGQLPRAGKGGSLSIIAAAPVKTPTFAPLVTALAATAGGVLPRGRQRWLAVDHRCSAGEEVEAHGPPD